MTLLNDTLSIRGADGVAEKYRVESHEHLLRILDEHFGITLPADATLRYDYG